MSLKNLFLEISHFIKFLFAEDYILEMRKKIILSKIIEIESFILSTYKLPYNKDFSDYTVFIKSY